MALLPDGSKRRLKELADEVGVPESFLAKILQSLTHAELVVSRRGPEGGFELVPSARGATMLQVIEAIEGRAELNVCLGDVGCERSDWCPAHLVWVQAQDAMLGVLRGATIAELADIGERRKLTKGITGEPSQPEP